MSNSLLKRKPLRFSSINTICGYIPDDGINDEDDHAMVSPIGLDP